MVADKYLEILCASPEDVVREISLRVNDGCEFQSVIVKMPTAFLLRMKLRPLIG